MYSATLPLLDEALSFACWNHFFFSNALSVEFVKQCVIPYFFFVLTLNLISCDVNTEV